MQVIARKDELSHTKYAALIGPKLLTTLEDYFKIKFPLPKLDMVGVPDFGFMAMENWGFITFRYIWFQMFYSHFSEKNIGPI